MTGYWHPGAIGLNPGEYSSELPFAKLNSAGTAFEPVAEPSGGTGVGGFAPLTGSSTVAVYTQSDLSVAASTYATVFDITSGGLELVGGSIYAASVGLRLTIDGTVVLNETGSSFGRTSGNDAVSVVALPQAKALTSMKLEAYNPASTRAFGWRVFTRVP